VITRRNIHTYPFKYQYYDYDDYFAPESSVLYLHVPFCIKKCGFCDYTVYINRSEDAREQYVQALEQEVRAFPQHGVFPRFSVDAVYFGGGTPGILEAGQLIRLLDACRETFDLAPEAEICLEFDPPTVTAEKVRALGEAGFNRFSVGVQAFDDDLLRMCNRSHDVATAERAYEIIRGEGFSHVNLDLIFPLPNLTFDVWKHAVDRAIELEPGCLTTYGLEIWPKTSFHHGIVNNELTLPAPEEEQRMYAYAIDALDAAGFQRTSSTGYHHPERSPQYSRFLEYYWRTWPMIGFGVSSKSVIHNRLFTNVKGLKQYYELVGQGRIPMDFATHLTKNQEMRRVVIRGLKMCTVSRSGFEARFGVDIDLVFGAELMELFAEELLAEDGDEIVLTRKGQIFSTNVYERFYTDEDLSPAGPGQVKFGISELVQ
jgi:oxygen-independent coproporphyrinogen III oxidase